MFALSTAAAACWLASYSWVLGLIVPADVLALVIPMALLLTLNISPWLVAEIAAILLGLAAAGVAVRVVGEKRDGRRKAALLAGVGGAAVALLSFLSLASPA
ncbi:hypothetical protein GCM10023168_28620 [Fodinibacter luteus]|uniref:Uncharacterized protein n=1 Tax=Fodinibacter luteus TaxID=552064 RepID=A0ABP8KM65_9MICO